MADHGHGAKGTLRGVRSPIISFYWVLPGKSADEGRQVLAGYLGTVVADGFAVYEVPARDGPAFTLAHCWVRGDSVVVPETVGSRSLAASSERVIAVP